MKLINQTEHQQFIDYLPRIKQDIDNWQLVDIKLLDTGFTVEGICELLLDVFSDYDGRAYVCNEHNILMLVHWAIPDGQLALSRKLQSRLPPGSCEILIHAPDAEGLKRLELRLHAVASPTRNPAPAPASATPNTILVVDDDLYMRMLVRKGLDASRYSVHEIIDGNDVLRAYKHHKPNILFLDIHLPGREGSDILREIIAYDSKAYVVMLSADSSPENVQTTIHMGAKDFLTKPFTKEKLLEVVYKCPTIC